MKRTNTTNILVIGDIHTPFTLDGYLEFCKKVYKLYKCTHAIFIGDIIDSHATSLHDPDPDLYSPGDELFRARVALQDWHKAFPNADVVVGNHDKRSYRVASRNRITRHWMKDYKEVLKTPSWTFQDEFVYDDVRYIHGEGSPAHKRAKENAINTVCGDKHTLMYVQYFPRLQGHTWAMQVGCGIDRQSKAFAYAINHPPQAIGCGVVLNHGALPITIPYHGYSNHSR